MKHLSKVRSGISFPVLCGIMVAFSVITMVFYGNQTSTELSDTIKLCILSVIFNFINLFYIRTKYQKLREKPYFGTFLILLYGISLLLVVLTKGSVIISLWMIGGILAALLFDLNYGFLTTYNFIFLAGFIAGYRIENSIYLLILGTIFCLFSEYMKRWVTMGYTIIIVLSLQIILRFILNNFIIKDTINDGFFYSVLSSLLLIFVSYLTYQLYNRKLVSGMAELQPESVISEVDDREGLPEGTTTDINKENNEIDTSRPVIIQKENDISLAKQMDAVPEETDNLKPELEKYLDMDFPLLQRMKTQNRNIYRHSLYISDLSGKAAKAVGANEALARAGGLYHEVGRLENKQYVEEGIKLAQAYHLPDIVVEIIKQHNLKYGKPQSAEAAIVMFSISVAALKEQFDKTHMEESDSAKKQDSFRQILEELFLIRFDKGNLDESGLSLKQYKGLKEFYLHM